MDEINKPSLYQVTDKDEDVMGDQTLGGNLNGGTSANGDGGTSLDSSTNGQTTPQNMPTEPEFRGNSLDSVLAMFGSTFNGNSHIDSSGTIYFKDKNPGQTDPKYFDAALTVTDPKHIASFMDKMGPMPNERTSKPLEYKDTIKDKRNARSVAINRQELINEYNLRIGDSVFIIPPEYIQVNDTSHTKVKTALRQSSSFKTKTGHTNRDILITLYFSGIEQINGHEDDSPFEYNYSMDGLLSLIAQFRCTPFLPIQNEYLNINFSIFSVALQSMSVSTVQGFPGLLSVTLSMQEFYSTPYTLQHNMSFDDMIDWDLFRYYYQRYLNKKLGKISNNDLNGDFTFSVLDKVKLIENPKIDLKDEKNYYNILEKNNRVEIVDMSFTMSNILANLQMQEHPIPTTQFLGGTDVYFNMTLETTDNSIVSLFNDVATITQTMTRDFTDFQGIGFIRIKNEITKLFGINNFMLNSLQINTVPEYPGLSVINVECISYELGTSKDVMTGMRPFEGNKEGTIDDCIQKKVNGVYNKARQDNVIERKIMKLELYPDLYLPKYSELDDAIGKIQKHKKSNNMNPLTYDKYPRPKSYSPGEGDSGTYNEYVDPDFYFFYSNKWQDNTYDKFIKATTEGGKLDTNNDGEEDYSVEGKVNKKSSNNESKSLIGAILKSGVISDDGNSILSIPFCQSITPATTIGREFAIGEDKEEYERAWTAGNYKYERGGGFLGGSSGGAVGDLNVQGMGNLQVHTGNALCDLAISRKDISWYVWGAEGQTITTDLLNSLSKSHGSSRYKPVVWDKANKGLTGYDCAGLIRWCLKQLGVKDKSYYCTSGPMYSTVDQKISKEQLQPGDLLWKSGHVALYAGNGQTIEAMSSDKGVCIGKVGNRFTGFGRFNNVPSTQDVLAKMGNSGGSSSETANNQGTQQSQNNQGTQNKPSVTTRRTLRNEFITVEKISKEPKAPINMGTTGNKPSTSKPSTGSSTNTSTNTNNQQGFSNGVPNLNHQDANVDWGHGINPSQLDSTLKNKLAGSGAYWVGYGNIYKVNPGLCAAISYHETGNGTSSQINKYNNPGGLRAGGDAGSYTGSHGTFAKFSCLQEGIRTKVSLISRRYVGEGRRTLADIGAKYCPPSDPNDREGLNSGWPKAVGNAFQKIMGYQYDPSKSGTGVKNEMLEPATGGWNGGTDGSALGGVGGGWSGPLIGNYVAPPPSPERKPLKDAGIVFGRKLHAMYGDESELEKIVGKVDIKEISKVETSNDDNDKDKTDKESNSNEVEKQSRAPLAPDDVDLNQKPKPPKPKPKPKPNTPNGNVNTEVTDTNTSTNTDGANTENKEEEKIKPQDKEKPLHIVKDLNSFGRPIFIYSPLNASMKSAEEKDITSDKYIGGSGNHTPINELMSEEDMEKALAEIAAKQEADKNKKDEDNRKIPRVPTTDSGSEGVASTTPSTQGQFKSPIFNEGQSNYYDMCSYGDTSSMTPSLMCVDMETYSHNGRMTRAFPTFLFMILDDGGDWMDAKKLWSNFYAYKPVVDIRLHQDYSNPVQTAAITLSNISSSLDSKESPYDKKKNLGDGKGIVNWIYRKTGLMLSAPKIDEEAVKLKNNIYDTINLKEGARIHLRMGYGSNPLGLPICFNGHIAEIDSNQESVFFIAQSDGVELINNVVSTKDNQTNTMVHYGSEPSNVVGALLVERETKWLNILSNEWGERSRFGIEHFGTHLGFNRDDADAKEYDLLKNIYLGVYRMTRLCEGEWRSAFKKTPIDIIGNIANAMQNTFGDSSVIQGIVDEADANANNSTLPNDNNTSTNNRLTPRAPIVDPDRPEWRPPTTTKPSTPKPKPNPTSPDTDLSPDDNTNTDNPLVDNPILNSANSTVDKSMDEMNINVFLFNKTPWDCFKMFEQSIPEFICQPGYHQFDSRLFFGMPHFLFSYRYDLSPNGSTSKPSDSDTVYEAVKTFAQFHYIDGLDNIIDNSVKASSKELYNNCVVTYSLGGELDSTPTIYSDRTIYGEHQKTKIIDSSINQDYLGIEKIYKATGFAIGKNAAVHTGISCILDSWKKTYKGTLTLFGDASIKPCDYIYINDNSSQMYGMCEVRECIHEFSMSTGFTTIVTPGLIGTTTLKNSGFSNISRSLITLGSSFASNYYLRSVGVRTMQNFVSNLAISKTAKTYINTKLAINSIDKETLVTVGKYYDEVIDFVKTGNAIDKMKEIAVGAKNVITGVDKLKDFKTLKDIGSSVKMAFTASGSVYPVVGNIVGYIVSSIIMDWMLNTIIDEFMYNNSINVYPLVHKDKPLIAGAKGHSKLIPGCGESAIDLKSDSIDFNKQVWELLADENGKPKADEVAKYAAEMAGKFTSKYGELFGNIGNMTSIISKILNDKLKEMVKSE